MGSIALKTYAKINLSLDVTGVREDGYHEVAMVMQAVNLYDEMKIRISPAEKSSITLKTDKYYIPVDDRNTAYKAAQVILDEFTPEPVEIRIDIGKRIPAAAGLAGGSSNAAGVLIGLNVLLKLGLDLEGLCRLGLRIGADVPFCIMSMVYAERSYGVEGGSACALAEGIGEVLTPLPSADAWIVLAKPPVGVSTPAVYKALDAVSGYAHPDTEAVINCVKNGDITGIKEKTGNVLEVVTVRDFPVVAELMEKMRAAAAELELNPLIMMSGSGPTVFAVFTEQKDAEALYEALKGAVDRKTEIFCVNTL